MAVPKAFLDEVRARVALSRLVGRRVQLKQRQRDDWWGLSPFANEKTPSFHVRDDQGFYHCFASGEHGDHFSWLMKVEGLSFPEAIERLAEEAGLEVPKSSPEERQREEKRKTLYDVVDFAARWFEARLREPVGRAALDYLKGRGLRDETIASFRLGFAPNERASGQRMADAAAKGGIEMPALIEAGLYRRPDDGRQPYAMFRDRVMFTINDARGRPIAFGGRFMGDAKAAGIGKYVNSPDTPLFDKSATLYNIDRARDAVRGGNDLLVVEGYMDAIALNEAGFPAAVAPLGTAVTERHIAALWRMEDEPILCLDGDEAGRRAALRAGERALPGLLPGKSLRFAFMPPGEDPDTLVRSRGVEAFRQLLAENKPLDLVLWESERGAKPVDTPERRADLEMRLKNLSSTIQDETVRRQYFRGFMDRAFHEWRAQTQAQRGGFKARLKRGTGYGGNRGSGRRTYGGDFGYGGGYGDVEPMGKKLSGGIPALTRRQQQVVLATLVNHPAIIADYDEALEAFAFDADLDKLRAALQKRAALASDGDGEMLDAAGLRSHLNDTGHDAALRSVCARDVFQFARQARADTPDEEARTALDHILLIRTQDRLNGEVRNSVGETAASTVAGDASAERRFFALSRSYEDGEGRLGLGLGDGWGDGREDLDEE